MIAVLSHSHKVAVIDLERDYRLQEFSRTTGRGKFEEGQDFKIVTQDRDLHGLKFDAILIYGRPEQELVDTAYMLLKRYQT